MTRRIRIKKKLLDHLRKSDLATIFDTVKQYDESPVLNALYTALYHNEEIIRWHAISTFGVVVDAMAGKDLESARIVMRRFLWSLNDESGGIGWGAPEAMAEIMAKNAQLFSEYNHMLLSYMRQDGPGPFQDGNFLELPELQRGVVWGVGRLAGLYGDVLRGKGVVDDLLPYLHSRDPVVRGMAAWALGALKAVAARQLLEKLLNDSSVVNLYMLGRITETTVGGLACQSLASFA